MNVQSFNQNLVATSNELINFNKYTKDIIQNVFIKNDIFKDLHDNSEKKGQVIPLSLLENTVILKLRVQPL